MTNTPARTRHIPRKTTLHKINLYQPKPGKRIVVGRNRLRVTPHHRYRVRFLGLKMVRYVRYPVYRSPVTPYLSQHHKSKIRLTLWVKVPFKLSPEVIFVWELDLNLAQFSPVSVFAVLEMIEVYLPKIVKKY